MSGLRRPEGTIRTIFIKQVYEETEAALELSVASVSIGRRRPISVILYFNNTNDS